MEDSAQSTDGRQGAEADRPERKQTPLDDVAFDEMNLVELPFELLTRDTDGVYEIPRIP